MKIGALARSLGVPVPTLRRWTQEFAEGLGPDARGGDGRPREFTPRDQRVLRRAQVLLADREVTYAQARQQLREEGLLSAPAPASDPGPSPEEERASAERFVAVIVERVSLPWVQRVEALEREVASLRQELADLRAPPDSPEPAADAGRRRWPFG